MSNINIYGDYTLDTLREALMCSSEDAETVTDVAVALCNIIAALIDRVTAAEERQALLEVQISELRHKAGVTEVDEVYEAARAS